jgi:EmrB/QacA subfamily drug resistance transporter
MTGSGPVLVVAVLASGMVFIDGTALNVALPALQESLSATGPDLLAIVNSYTLFLTALLLLGGALGDRYGRRRFLSIGISAFAVASWLCGIAPDTRFLIAARAVQGVGAALVVPGSLALITACIGVERRGRAIGVWSACSVLLTAVGPFLGGLLAQARLWRGIFFLNVPLTVIALAILWLAIPESRDDEAPRRLDYAGAVTATLGLLGVNYGLIALSAPHRNLAVVALSLVGGVGSLALFLVVETRSEHPLLPLKLFRSRTFCGANLLTLCLYTGFNGMFLFLPLNLIQIQGYSASLAGLSQIPVMLLLVLVSPGAGGLADRYGPRPLLIAGPLIAGIGFACFAIPGVTIGPGDYWKTFLPALVLLGLGMGLTIAPLSSAVVASVDVARSGLASGINSTAARLAGVLAVGVLGPIGIMTFRASLESQLVELSLPESVQTLLTDEAVNLGHLRIPQELDAGNAGFSRKAVSLSFVNSFRLISFLAAALSWLGAALAAVLNRHK